MSKRILAVDDSVTMREMIAFTLRQAGFEVEQADNGESALKKVNGSAFDVIITDINMPQMDGYHFIEQVRQGQSASKAAPILILTTEVDQERKDRGKAVGATGWITKPFNPERLVEIVGKVCAG